MYKLSNNLPIIKNTKITDISNYFFVCLFVLSLVS